MEALGRLGNGPGAVFMQNWHAVGTQGDSGVLRKLIVNSISHFSELSAQIADEPVRSRCDSGSRGVFLQMGLTFLPWQQVSALIGEGLGTGDAKVAGLQMIRDVGKEADF